MHRWRVQVTDKQTKTEAERRIATKLEPVNHSDSHNDSHNQRQADPDDAHKTHAPLSTTRENRHESHESQIINDRAPSCSAAETQASASQTARQPARRERQATRLACLGFFFFFCIIFIFIFIFIFFIFSLSLSRLSRPKIQRSCNRECPDTQPPTRDSLTLTSMSCPDAV